MNPSYLQPEYDVVIIGAGMGGLTAAGILSRAGLSVCVLEMASKPGGYLAGFQRQQFRFDTAIHWLNQCLPGGLVHTVFEALGTDYPKTARQQRVKRIVGDAHDYLLTANPDDLKAQLQRDFPHEARGLGRFFDTAKQIGHHFNTQSIGLRAFETLEGWEKVRYAWHGLRFIRPFLPHVFYSGDAGVKRGLRRYFKDERLLGLFSSEPDMLSCLIPIGWCYAGDFQNPPAGGAQSFPEWLEHLVTSLGNHIFYHSRAHQILLQDGRACGVAFERHGEQFQVRARHVIATGDVETLYEKMLPPAAVPEDLKARLRKAELYSSSLTLSVALDCDPARLGFHEEMVQLTRQDVPRAALSGGDPQQAEILVMAPSLRNPSLAPTGQGTLAIFMPAWMHHHQNWRAGRDAQGGYVRGAAYTQLKTELAEALLQRVEARVAPGLRQHILFYDVATPITHYRYTGNKDGTMMGARPGKENSQAKIAHYRTPVPNLLLGGHWAELGGGVPIAVKAGFNAALLVLQKQNRAAFAAFAQYTGRQLDAPAIRQHPALRPYANDWQRQPTPAEIAGSVQTIGHRGPRAADTPAVS
ncbi:MAG: NAD(P)/FAD-dependent oxidoreductase [Verrucomicrobiota bacterium]